MGSWCSGLGTTELLRGLHWSLFIVDPSPPHLSTVCSARGQLASKKRKTKEALGPTQGAKMFCFSSFRASIYNSMIVKHQQMHACKIVRYSLVPSLLPPQIPFCYFNPALLCLHQLSRLNCWILLDLPASLSIFKRSFSLLHQISAPTRSRRSFNCISLACDSMQRNTKQVSSKETVL